MIDEVADISYKNIQSFLYTEINPLTSREVETLHLFHFVDDFKFLLFQ
jgi:hypothetical protein